MGQIADVIRDGVALPVQKRQQMLALDVEFEELKSKLKVLEAENLQLRALVEPLKREVERLKQQAQQSAPNTNPDGYFCDHCGSPKLKRTGSRLSEQFGEVGIKDAIFSCLECGKESAFMQTPKT